MKNIKFFAVAAFALIMGVSFTSCTTVEPGEIGLKVHKLGDQKGQIEVIGVGREPVHWFGYYSIEKYPTIEQQWSWTADEREGSPTNQEIVYQSVEGETASADIGIAFAFSSEPEKLINMYQTWMKDPQEIIDNILYKDVRNAFNEFSQSMNILDLYASKKEEIRQNVKDKLRAYYGPLGIDIIDIYYLSEVRVPSQIKSEITAKIAAEEKAKRLVIELQGAEAEANKVAATADGLARAAIREAEGRAEAMNIEGKAIRSNPQYLQLKELDVKREMAASMKGWQYANFSASQSASMFGIK
ncbi:MAG: SPFH domain-containing protein [Alphaproteobacteria bacterium]